MFEGDEREEDAKMNELEKEGDAVFDEEIFVPVSAEPENGTETGGVRENAYTSSSHVRVRRPSLCVEGRKLLLSFSFPLSVFSFSLRLFFSFSFPEKKGV